MTDKLVEKCLPRSIEIYGILNECIPYIGAKDRRNEATGKLYDLFEARLIELIPIIKQELLKELSGQTGRLKLLRDNALVAAIWQVKGTTSLSHLKAAAQAQLEADLPLITPIVQEAKKAVAEEIKRELEENHPYSPDIFPRTTDWAAKLERDKGLSDDEITGVSGALGRLGYNVALQNLQNYIDNLE